MVKKVSIIGVGGVGSNLAFHLLSRLDLEELILLDISGDLAKGIALDLEDTRAFLGFTTTIVGTHKWEKTKNSDIVVVSCGKARGEGQTRYDLLKENLRIAKEVALKIRRFSPFSIVIVVTNPVDFITYVIKKETGFERKRVMGLGGVLDGARLINLIYKETGLDVGSLEALVVGFHSKDMIPLVSKMKVRGINLEELAERDKIETLKEKTKGRGAEIVKFLRTRSACFAPSLSAYHMVETVVKNKRRILCVSVYTKGEYGLRNICVGLPCIVGRSGIIKIVEVDLSPQERKALLDAERIFKECMI
ncbi:MAG: malate dehydrogenase [Candidatus Omnitrophota bacterium]|nr:MAG: malate dehydrogenase [Candidatus Omnitrophota bacterium]